MPEWLAIKDTVKVLASDAHRFGTDAILLAHFAAPAHNETVCELGTGCGAIALRLCAEGSPEAVHGVDIAAEAIDMARQSAAAFVGTPTPTFAVADWCDPASIGAAGSFRRVVCNPPYFPPHSGGVSADEATRRARHETPTTLEDVCHAAAWLLQYGGKCCLCHRPERLNAVLAALTAHGLEPKRLRAVQQTADAAPWLFLIEARKGGHAGLTWEAPLILREADGMPSAAYRAIYGGGLLICMKTRPSGG